jgi:hypothetical protein
MRVAVDINNSSRPSFLRATALAQMFPERDPSGYPMRTTIPQEDEVRFPEDVYERLRQQSKAAVQLKR